jgi:flavodoxin, short chain
MSKVMIVYWSGTGNTEKMAQLIADGSKEAGAEVTMKTVSEAKPDEVANYDVVAIGSPSMGAEVLEESEMEPFVEDISALVKGCKLALFGSYDWGDGEWMRNWVDRMEGAGARIYDGEGLIVHLTPEGEDAEKCKALGKGIASF